MRTTEHDASMKTSQFRIALKKPLATLPQRLGSLALIGIGEWLVGAPVEAQWWALMTGLTMLADALMQNRLARAPARMLRGWAGRFAIASSAVCAVMFATLSIFAWQLQTELSFMAFCLINIGAMQYNALAFSNWPPTLWALSAPPAALLVGAPLAAAFYQQNLSMALIAIACILFVTMTAGAFRNNQRNVTALRGALLDSQAMRSHAERATQAKSDFLAVMSHEIRTPLNAVVAAAHLFDRPDMAEDQRRHAQMLQGAADTLTALLNDVLDISRIEAGKIEIDSVPFPLRERLAELTELWRPRAEAKGLEFIADIPEDAPARALGDPLRLQQILSNLISNAVKFTREGSVTVTVEWQQWIGLIIDVTDTGRGIPGDKLEAVFGTFEQARGGEGDHPGGAGLGLAISRRLARHMGGDITVASIVRRGSRFRLELPLKPLEAAEDEESAEAAQQTSLEGMRILAADDNDVNRMVLDALLGPLGCKLTLVCDGGQAVDAARAERFEAILLDMRMPNMDGVEAARRIRRDGANRETPIVALTANAFDAHREAWAAVGANGFIPKPIRPDVLTTTLGELRAGVSVSAQVLRAG